MHVLECCARARAAAVEGATRPSSPISGRSRRRSRAADGCRESRRCARARESSSEARPLWATSMRARSASSLLSRSDSSRSDGTGSSSPASPVAGDHLNGTRFNGGRLAGEPTHAAQRTRRPDSCVRPEPRHGEATPQVAWRRTTLMSQASVSPARDDRAAATRSAVPTRSSRSHRPCCRRGRLPGRARGCGSRRGR